MKYKELKSIHNIDLMLLHNLRIVKVGSEVYKIDHLPDYDKTPYGGTHLTQYYFDDYWDFLSKYHSVIHVSIGSVYIFHYDDICSIVAEYDITYERYEPISILEKALEKNSGLFFEAGMNPDIDDFSLNDLQLKYVDNHKKRLLFHGGVSAASDTVTDCDWDLYTLDDQVFYKLLILLLLVKTATFMA